jgi:phage-related protein
MKLTKTILVAALVVGGLFAGNTAVFAQAGGGGRAPMTSDSMITRFQTALGETNKLTDAEIPQVKTVLDTMIKQQADLRADTTVVQADRSTKRKAITKEATDALKPIVTPAQFKVIQPLLQRGGRRGGAGGGAPVPAPAT